MNITLAVRLMYLKTLAFVIIVLLTASACGSACAQHTGSGSVPPSDAKLGTAAQEHDVARRLPLKGVSNSGEVTKSLYRGGQPTQESLEVLAKMGIDIVVDLRQRSLESERTEVTKLGMQYIQLPWQCSHPNDATLARFLALLREN